jgi:hypothetical protein
MGRAVRSSNWTEQSLIDAGYIRNINTLGVVYYTDPADADFDWIQDTNDKYWHKVPWHLIENPYTSGNSDPSATRDTATGRQGREMTAAALGQRIACVYGELQMGGDVFFPKLIGNTYYMGLGLGHGELDSIRHLYFPYQGTQNYDAASTGAYWQWEFKGGAITQTASTLLATARGLALGSTPIHPGLGYVALKFVYDEANFPDVPTSPKLVVRGRKCYDPRLDVGFAGTGVCTRNATTVVWTRNDSLILADYMWDDWFGLGLGGRRHRLGVRLECGRRLRRCRSDDQRDRCNHFGVRLL